MTGGGITPWVQAIVVSRQGRWEEAERALQEGLSLAQSMRYPYAEGRLLNVDGEMHFQREELERARERLEAAHVAEMCRWRGIPESCAPRIVIEWHGRAETAIKQRRDERRRVAYSTFEELEKDAIVQVKTQAMAYDGRILREAPQLLDLHGDLVADLQERGWLAEGAHARRRAREDDVAWGEGDALGDERDQVGDIEEVYLYYNS